MPLGFAEELSRLVDRRMKETGDRKRQIAERAGLSPVAFSQLLTGARGPRSRQVVLAVAAGMGLGPTETNGLLAAAGFRPESSIETGFGPVLAEQIAEAVRSRANGSLFGPDRAVLTKLAAHDIDVIVGAWSAYFGLRNDLYHRHWNRVIDQAEHNTGELYSELRRISSRFYAYFSLHEAAAHHYRGELSEALSSAKQAMSASRNAGEPMLICRCHVRTGDIYKISGKWDLADEQYTAAEHVIVEWSAKRSSGSHESDLMDDERQWTIHWLARIERKRGTLALYRGHSLTALEHLRSSLQSFERLNNRYELARTHYSIGWAYSQLGDWDSAVISHQMGLDLTTSGSEEERGFPDPRQRVEGHLCLAGDCINLRDFVNARHYLDLAEKDLADRELKDYHERSRYLLLEGRFYRDSKEHRDLIRAHRHFTEGIALCEGKDPTDPCRLASLYNARGVLELENRNFVRSIEDFRSMIRWSEQLSPPNKFYGSLARINLLMALLESEDSAENLDPKIVEDARKAGEDAQESGNLRNAAKADVYLMRYYLQVGNHDAAIERAIGALRTSLACNEHVVSEMTELMAQGLRQMLPHDARSVLQKMTISFLAAPVLDPRGKEIGIEQKMNIANLLLTPS